MIPRVRLAVAALALTPLFSPAATPLLDTPVSQVAVSPDGHFLAASDAQHLSLFDLERVALLADSTTSATITCLDFSPAEPLLAAGGVDGSVAYYELPAGRLRSSFQAHRKPVIAVAFDAAGRMLATASADSTIGVWIVRNNAPRAQLRGHTDLATGVAWSPESALYSTSWDGTLRRWDYARTFQPETLHAGSSRLRALSLDTRGRPIFGTEDGMPGTASRGPVTSILLWRNRAIAAHDDGTVWRAGDPEPARFKARKLAADSAGARIAAATLPGLILYSAEEFAALFP